MFVNLGTTSFVHVLPAVFNHSRGFILGANALSEKVYNIVLPHFKAGSALFFCSYGSYRISQMTRKEGVAKGELIPPGMHGGLLIGTGLCTGLEALHAFSVINLGNFFTRICETGEMLFFFANLVALEENIHLYEHTSNFDGQLEIDKKITSWTRQSAMWGILSNLGYIVATAMMLFDVSTAIALLLGLLSACAGGLKILHEVLIWANNLSEPININI